jgi:hypothetical protein
MPRVLIWLGQLLAPLLAQLGIGAAVGGVVYTFFTTVINPKLDAAVTTFLSTVDGQYSSLGTLAKESVTFLGIPMAVSLIAASWSVCMALRLFKLSLSFVKAAK